MTKTKSAARPERLSFNLADTTLDEIDGLELLSGATSRSEVVRRAISVYLQLLQTKGDVIIREGEKETRLIIS